MNHIQNFENLRDVPVILLTSKEDLASKISAFSLGADDYLTKPFEHAALVARVRAMLRIKALNDEIAALNAGLEARVARQVAELERMGTLKRFLAPQIAEMMVQGSADAILQPLASSLSCLTTDEKELGVVLVDIGGGTTEVGVVSLGGMVYAGSVRVGSPGIGGTGAVGFMTGR